MNDEPQVQSQPSLGEYRTGITFNPSNNDYVNEIKRRTSELIDLCDHLPQPAWDHGEWKRLVSLAMTHYEDAAMWAVKAATKQPR